MTTLARPTAAYDIEALRSSIPILTRETAPGIGLVYLDNAATSQKPLSVLDCEREYYEKHNANVHRGVHTLAEEATAMFEASRDAMAEFLGANRSEIVFTKSATESLNLLARSLGDWSWLRLGEGDEVVISEMEHHSNIVPWQMLCQRTGATLKWFPLTDDGRIDLDAPDIITANTRVVSIVHQSNILGTVNPVAEIARRAKVFGAIVVVDGCQSVPHQSVRVSDASFDDVDFLAFSGHKMLGPTGVGVLWGRYDLLAQMPPFLGGGEMIEVVSMESSTYALPPYRFEAGTPNIAQVIALGAAVEVLNGLGMTNVAEYEHALTGYALDALATVPGLSVVGPASNVDRGPAISWVMAGVHPHDVGQVLDSFGIAVRVGQHCARPVCVRYGIGATTRASFGPYSTTGEVDALVEGLHRVRAFFKL